MSFKGNIPVWLSAIATLFAALATVGLWYIASSINETQETVLRLQRAELAARKKAFASIIGLGVGLTFQPDPTGADWIHAEVTFRNTSNDYVAKNIRVIYQAFGVDSWAGFFDTWSPKNGGEVRETIDLGPGEKFTAIMRSQTAAKPLEHCMNGQRFFLAIRNDWESPNGELACRVNIIELSCPSGIYPGPRNREMLVRPIPWERLKDVPPPPAIWPCPD